MNYLDAVRAATVKVHAEDKEAGLGVLVKGGYILTSAHCIRIPGTLNAVFAGMAEGDAYRVGVTTAAGGKLAAEVCLVEPVSNLAVLSTITHWINPPEAQRYLGFVKHTKALALAPCLPRQRHIIHAKEVPVRIYSGRGAWTPGVAQRFDANSRVDVTTQALIDPCAAGGPIVDTKGRLVAIVAQTHGPSYLLEHYMFTQHPLVAACLPPWLLNNIHQKAKR